ncbi:MAG: TraR/DksA family transcriptional regulator [Thermodesulfobacteriota bacterium]
MDALMLENFSASLNALMKNVQGKVNAGMEAMADGDRLPPDEADRAAMEAERSFALLMRERDRRALEDIREALARIEAGEYGICEECGEDISLARLHAQPSATLCVHCRSVREEEGRIGRVAFS